MSKSESDPVLSPKDLDFGSSCDIKHQQSNSHLRHSKHFAQQLSHRHPSHLRSFFHHLITLAAPHTRATSSSTHTSTMAPRDSSPRASDHRRPYSDRRDHNPRDTRDTRPPRRDRSNSRDRAPHYSRGGGRGGANTSHRTSERDTRPTRSRSPTRPSHNNSARQRSPPRAPRGANAPNSRQPRKPNAKVEEPAAMAVDPDEDEETAMKRLMGFAGFKSTKNTKVPGNDKLYGVRKDKKTEYRQYMNRVGGFNRPLSPTRL